MMRERSECDRWNAGDPSVRSERLRRLREEALLAREAADRAERALRAARRPLVSTLCNDCGTKGKFRTRAAAFEWMLAHETKTRHADQMFLTADGRQRFRPLSLEGAVVSDEAAGLVAEIEGIGRDRA